MSAKRCNALPDWCAAGASDGIWRVAVWRAGIELRNECGNVFA